MPKFNENEKTIIHEKLFSEGERLFIQHGIKKVTIDDLANAAGIAKGSFYAFYTNKEHLYMDILAGLQKKIWERTDDFLQSHRSLPPKELLKQIFLWFFQEIRHYPLLMRHDAETTKHLFRRLPEGVLAAHARDDKQALDKLMEYGVTFKCDAELAAKTLQMLAITFLNQQNENDTGYTAAMEVLLNGAIHEIVGDDND